MKNDSTVLILCGGRGKRLAARTSQTPKVLVPVNGKPVVEYILTEFERQGFRKFVFATGYLSDQVETFLAKNHSEMDYVVSNAGESASMLKRIVFAQEYFSDYVFVAYGDTFIDIDYNELLASHLKNKAELTIVTGQIQNPFGVVTTEKDTNAITSFIEKPVYEHYIGCFVVNKSVWHNPEIQSFLAHQDGEGVVRLFNWLAQSRKLFACRHKGLQITFNTEQELQHADSVLRDYYTVRES